MKPELQYSTYKWSVVRLLSPYLAQYILPKKPWVSCSKTNWPEILVKMMYISPTIVCLLSELVIGTAVLFLLFALPFQSPAFSICTSLLCFLIIFICYGERRAFLNGRCYWMSLQNYSLTTTLKNTHKVFLLNSYNTQSPWMFNKMITVSKTLKAF